jgi:hypothetical protein
MNGEASFSVAGRWRIGAHLAVSLLSLLALVVMTNYLAARHFKRRALADAAPIQLSLLTQRVLSALTNEVRVIIYFDREEAPTLYEWTRDLLKEYRFANPRLSVETVDYTRDPGAANLVKARYRLTQKTDKNLVIFECQDRTRVVAESELSDFDFTGLLSGETREVRRTHFKGEPVFTAAILGVTTARPQRAYYLQDHKEHRFDGSDAIMGYARFAALLREMNLQIEPLTLLGSSEIPTDCSLLIMAGPTDPLLPEELDKLDRYLQQGGRLLALLNFYSAARPTGLEKLLGRWGVVVGQDVVTDRKFTVTGQDLIVTDFGDHAVMRPLYGSRLYLVLPRSVVRAAANPASADAPQVEALLKTSSEGRVITDLRGEAFHPGADDFVGTVSLAAAVEKGSIRGVSADRGATRLVVVGESIFLGNETIEKLGNRDFAIHAINWLLARHDLLVNLGPRPVKEYKVTMSTRQLAAVRWMLMLGLPAAVLIVGAVVMVRRK